MSSGVYERSQNKSSYVGFLLRLIDNNYFGYEDVISPMGPFRKVKNLATYCLVNKIGTLDQRWDIINYTPHIDFAFNYHSSRLLQEYREIPDQLPRSLWLCILCEEFSS